MKSPIARWPSLPIALCTLALASACIFSSGCVLVAVGAGAGTVAYVRGDLQATLDASVSASTRAVDRAIEDRKFAKISEHQDALSAEVIARTALDKKVTIFVQRKADNVTEVRIRIGAFGDQELSVEILEKIKARL